MKYILTTLAIFLNLCYQVQAQKSQELDAKNGFNKFHFGQSLTEIKKFSRLKSIGKDLQNKHMTYYQVKDIERFKIFEYALQQIDLIFYDGELYGIGVTPELKYSTEQRNIIYKDIFERIQQQYGAFTEIETNAGDKLSGIKQKYELSGKKVLLRFSSGINSYAFYDIETRNKVINELDSGL